MTPVNSGFFLARLSGDDLIKMHGDNLDLYHESGTLAHELHAAYSAEHSRRDWNENNPDEPREAVPVLLNVGRWCGAELAEGLLATAKTRKQPESDLFRALHAVIVVAAADRLKLCD